MDGKFNRKSRLVANGITTALPSSITYSSVVSRESVGIEFLIASLNDLDIFACDIGNVYLNAKCREKLWTEAGTQFGTEKRMIIIIGGELYRLKISGAALRAKLTETLILLGYKLSEEDDDVQMKQDFNPKGDPYYKYMLCYVNELIHIGFNQKEDMDALNIIYRLKQVFVPPDQYRDANVDKVQLKDKRVVWSTNCVNYLKSAIENVDNSLGVDKTTTKNYGDGHRPYSSIFKPELDVTEEMVEELTNRYQKLIGVLRWSIELVRIDILTEVSCLSQQLCSPREGHLDSVYRIFRYLQKNLGNKPGRIA